MNYKFIVIGILNFMLTLAGDQYIFNSISDHLRMYIFIKVLVLVFLLFIWNKIGYCLRHYKENQALRSSIKWFLLYFSFLLVVLICIWPGNWFWDDIEIFNYARSFTLLFWQHKLTGILYMFSLAIFPFAAGVIIIQSFFAACVFASLMYKFKTIFPGTKLTCLFILPFIAMPVLFQIMFPLRLTLFSFLVLYVLFEICYLMKTKEKVSNRTIYKIMLLTAILSAWRTEAILYIVIIPILLFVCLRKQIIMQTLVKGVVILIIGYMGLYFFQYFDVSPGSRDHYFYTGVINPLNGLVKSDLKGKHLEENLNTIDKIIKIDVLRKYETGEKAFFAEPGMINDNATNEEKKKFRSAYLSLVCDNFDVFMKERIHSFRKSNLHFMVPDFSQSELERHRVFDGLAFNQPISRSLRASVLRFLAGEDTSSVGWLYNSYCYAVILFVIFVMSIVYKEKFLFLFSITLLFHLLLVLCTAPAYFHMYYFTFQLCSYVGMIYLICGICTKNG